MQLLEYFWATLLFSVNVAFKHDVSKTCKPVDSVVFVGGRLPTWESYQKGEGYLGGEAYWASGLEYLLKADGVKLTHFGDFTPGPEAKKACADPGCLMIVDGYPEMRLAQPISGKLAEQSRTEDGIEQRAREKLLVDARIDSLMDEIKKNDPDLRPRVRVLHWWGGYGGPYSENVLVPFAVKSITGRPVPFFVQGAVLHRPNPNLAAMTPRGRKVFVFGKALKADICESHVKPLLDAKFEVHMTTKQICHGMKIEEHGMLKPPDFSALLGTMAVVIGLGNPLDSPTPFEGLAAGAAFLNPFKDKHDITKTTQVKSLAEINEPFVYNYDIRNTSAMVDAAEKAVAHRFATFVPQAHKMLGVKTAMCKQLYEPMRRLAR